MKAVPRHQEMQAVLEHLGYDVGSSGLDGKIGDDTKAAMQRYANDHGLKGKTQNEIENAIVKNMKDPAFRQAMIDDLKNKPQTRDNVASMQWAFAASGHSDLYMRDPVSGLMRGKMNDQTQFALDQTVSGAPTHMAYLQMGIPETVLSQMDRQSSFAAAAREATTPTKREDQALLNNGPTFKDLSMS